ncbi:hypothetical protein IEO21_01758 [Rhodonia placenta]|uniref:Uncharacterized protein n=2 Tax=Rhodonia placenta TaxID=104341 RepID=A0A1X6NF94_9APHY|nr:hypothetical protein POSPLADRAFT_1037947 [Postia placenta MAD-698-R-SB12]KAF9819897.1 hypothetical protein IEO21_01758 [Postia placenta]OSX67319.1 hypothetical protein POSPLADRAFT_1037947 [Postia placenta MAD-698-R-SB12]
MIFTPRLPAQTTFYPSPDAIFITQSSMSDTVKCASSEANGGTCSWPTCGCAEPPRSK